MKKELKNKREQLIFDLYKYDLINEINEDNNELKDLLLKIEELDEIIKNNLYNYSLNRLSFLDRAIIRVATYELKYSNIHEAIIINEAIEVSKKYTDLDDEKQHKFNNKLLDNIKQSIRG